MVLEALASGTPVIGANSGGVKNVVQSGVTGALCHPGESKEFTNAIVQFLTHDSLRWQMGMDGENTLYHNVGTVFLIIYLCNMTM